MSDNANVSIVLDTGGNVDAKMREAAGSVDALNEHVARVGETFHSVFEALPGLLSGGGIDGAIHGIDGILGSLGESAEGAGAGLGAMGPALGVVATAGVAAASALVGLVIGVKDIVEHQTELISASNKLAESLRIPTDALMSLQIEAHKLANVGGEELDGAMQKLARSIGNASEDGGKAEQAFAKLGLSAGQLKNMNLDQSFSLIAERVSHLSSVQDQAAVTAGIFGKSGAQLIPIMQEGAAGIARARDEALRYGEAIGSVDASRVQEAGEVFEEVQRRVEGLKNELTVALAPSIYQIGEAFLGVIPDAQQFGVDVSAELMRVEVVVESLYHILSGLAGFMTLDLVGDASNIGKIGGEYDAVAKQMEDAQKQIDQAAFESKKAMRQAGQAIGDSFGEGIEQGANGAAKKVDEVTAITKKLSEAFDFEKYLHGSDGGIGAWLASKGIEASKIKDVFDIKESGGSDKQVMGAAEQAIQLHDSESADKAAKAMDELRNKLALLQGAAKDGIDPKVAEEIGKLHLDPNQAKEFQQLSGAIDAVGEHAKDLAKAAERIKDLKTELAAAQAGLSVDDYKAQQADPASAQQIKALQDQIDKTKEAAKTSEDAHKKLIEDAQKTYEETRTPIEKYWEAVKQLNQELALGSDHGGINTDTYDRALQDLQDKTHKEDKHSSEHNEDFATETRRFAQVLPQSNRDQSKIQQQQLEVATQTARDTRDIRNACVNPQAPQTVSLDSLA